MPFGTGKSVDNTQGLLSQWRLRGPEAAAPPSRESPDSPVTESAHPSVSWAADTELDASRIGVLADELRNLAAQCSACTAEQRTAGGFRSELAAVSARLDDLAKTCGHTPSSPADASTRHRKMSSIVSKAAMDTLSALNNTRRSSALPGSLPAEPPADRCSVTWPLEVHQGSMSMLRRRRRSRSGGTEEMDPCNPAPLPGEAPRRGSGGAAKAGLPLHERKEFPIVVMCAVFLATVAGWVNVVAMMSFRRGVSHVSGTSSMLANTAVQENWLELAAFAVLLVSFFLGAGASGIAVGNTKFVLGRKYGTVLVAVGVLLAAGVGVLWLRPRCSSGGEAACRGQQHCTWDAAAGQCQGSFWPELLALTLWATAMGCQNGMATTVSGAVVRTTHVTGVVTDLGLTIGQWLRHKRLRSGGSADLWKLRLHGPILVAFVSGGVLGSVAHGMLDDRAVLPPAVLYVIGGLVYNLGRRYGVFNFFLEENLMQEKIQALEGAFAEAVATAIEEAVADPAVDEIDDDLVGMDAEAAELMSPVIHRRSIPALPNMLSFRRQPDLPAPTTSTAL